MSQDIHPRTATLAYRFGALLCILLVFITGFVAAVHSHPSASRTPEHSCSVCALAHAGAVPISLGAFTPIFASSTLDIATTVSPRSLLAASSLYIRPPPVV